MAKINITYNRAIQIQNGIISQNGQQTVKSDLAKAKGDVGIQVYHLRHDIRETFKPLDEQRGELVKDYQGLLAEQKEADKKRAEEIDKELASLKEEIDNLGSEEKEFNLSKGKLKLSEVKNYLDTFDLEIFEPVIDFKK